MDMHLSCLINHAASIFDVIDPSPPIEHLFLVLSHTNLVVYSFHCSMQHSSSVLVAEVFWVTTTVVCVPATIKTLQTVGKFAVMRYMKPPPPLVLCSPVVA